MDLPLIAWKILWVKFDDFDGNCGDFDAFVMLLMEIVMISLRFSLIFTSYYSHFYPILVGVYEGIIRRSSVMRSEVDDECPGVMTSSSSMTSSSGPKYLPNGTKSCCVHVISQVRITSS